jgi:hypothetical protein
MSSEPSDGDFLAFNHEAEPDWYKFISKVCRTVSAPEPKRIGLDCQLRASGVFRKAPKQAATAREYHGQRTSGASSAP